MTALLDHMPPLGAWGRRGARIVVGYDGSPAAERALRWAADEAGFCRGRVVVVHCLRPGPHLGPELPAWHRRHLVDEAARTVRLRGHQVPVEERLISGDPGASLVSLTEPGDVLVVGGPAIGYGGAAGPSSVSVYCSRHAACPVVVIRPPA